jgi:hypothetical protein
MANPAQRPQGHADLTTPQTRRELLTSVGRYVALAVLVGGVGALAAKTACRKTPCRACPLLSRCDLSKADEARAEMAARKEKRS